MSTKNLPDDIRSLFLFFMLSLIAHGFAYGVINILTQSSGALPDRLSRMTGPIAPIAVDVFDAPLMGKSPLPLPPALQARGMTGDDAPFEKPGATGQRQAAMPLSDEGSEATMQGAPLPEGIPLSGPDISDNITDKETAGRETGEAGTKMTGAAHTAGKKPNLFLPEQRLAELTKEYEKESPKEEQGKTLQLNTSELKYQRYLVNLKNRIELFWEYPAPAIKNGWQGILQIDFTVKKDGTLEAVRFIKSSNYPALDDAAHTALKLAEPFPPFPENFGVENINIRGQFEYRFINAPAER
ncbi:MAG: TonB C-terminal domain-containing protein [Deltaproteobacteria bacterium]|nr:TonB C-terminal domain-containing protein [Deltaproteobacteria bacterium]